jgi:hypothetical protein
MTDKTRRLRKLMREHRLKAADVAAMLGRKPSTVNVWRCSNDERVIPDQALQLLELKLALRQQGGAA